MLNHATLPGRATARVQCLILGSFVRTCTYLIQPASLVCPRSHPRLRVAWLPAVVLHCDKGAVVSVPTSDEILCGMFGLAVALLLRPNNHAWAWN